MNFLNLLKQELNALNSQSLKYLLRYFKIPYKLNDTDTNLWHLSVKMLESQHSGSMTTQPPGLVINDEFMTYDEDGFNVCPPLIDPLDVNVAIIAFPCGGYGDVVLAIKIAKYIRYGLDGKGVDIYSRNVTIYTPAPEMFVRIGGIEGIQIEKMDTLKQKQPVNDCHGLHNLYNTEQFKGYCEDLFIIAPLISNANPDIDNVNKMFPRATYDNTLFITEYNTEQYNPYGANVIFTGIGEQYEEYMGLLFDSIGERTRPLQLSDISSAKLLTLGNYFLMYVSSPYDNSFDCSNNFLTMIAVNNNSNIGKGNSGNGKEDEIHIVTSMSVGEDLWMGSQGVTKIIKSDGTVLYEPERRYIDEPTGEKWPEITLHCEVLPVSREEMVVLMKHSRTDILVTGDQSVTDAIECGADKRIWYQVLGHKQNFAENLGKSIGNSNIGNIIDKIDFTSTSCGSLNDVSIPILNSRSFIRNNDFRIKAKPMLDYFFSTNTVQL